MVTTEASTARVIWSTLAALAIANVAAGSVPAAASASPATSAVTANLYAAPGGHGTACTRARPCPAATAVKEAAKDFQFFGQRVIVHLARGIYRTRLNADFLPPSGALSIRIEAPRGRTVVNAEGRGPALQVGVDTAPVTVIGLELTHGKAPSSTGIGGGVLDGGGDVTIVDSVITDNTARVGAGIGDAGGKVIVRSSTVSGNTASQTGGGISDTGGSVALTASTVSGNRVSGGLGGGIYSEDATLTVRDSTISGNTAGKTPPSTGAGGGIALQAVSGAARATVIASTVAHNQAAVAGGAVWAAGKSTFRFGGDILALNRAPTGAECGVSGASLVDLGFSVLDDNSCPHRASTEVVSPAAVGLRALAGNGGLTKTERIGATSAAHGVVLVTARLAGALFCARADQRGVPRRQGRARRCDAGAYQFAPPHVVHLSPGSGPPGTKVTISGYGFGFISLRFGAVRAGFRVDQARTKIITRVPAHGPATVTVRLSNVDGMASRTFKITR